MEHKTADEIIRKKIQALERQPICWQKDEVWKRIEHSHTSSRRLVWYYSIAASFALLLSAFLAYNNYINHRQAMHLKISAIQKRLEAPALNNQAGIYLADSSCNIPQDKETNLHFPRQQERRQSKKLIQKITTDTPDLIASSDTPPTHLPLDTLFTTTQEVADAQPLQQRRIRMVIGIIPSQESMETNNTRLATKNSSKLELRLFKGDKEETNAKPLQDSKFIIARIK